MLGIWDLSLTISPTEETCTLGIHGRKGMFGVRANVIKLKSMSFCSCLLQCGRPRPSVRKPALPQTANNSAAETGLPISEGFSRAEVCLRGRQAGRVLSDYEERDG